MAVTTLDGALAGMQPPVFFAKGNSGTVTAGQAISFWPVAGSPSSGLYSTAIGGGQRTSTAGQVQGQLYHANPGSGNAYLARFEALASGGGGVLILADRLLDVGVTSTGPFLVSGGVTSTLASTGLPARDNNGSSAGVGVMLGWEVTTALSGAGGSISASYTNSTGVASHTAITFSTTGTIAAAAPVGSFYFTGLAAGDIGVQSIQTVTLSTAWTSGNISAVLFRPICSLDLPSSGIPNSVDALTAGFPQLFNGSVPFLIFVPSNANTTSITGSLSETQG